MNKKHLFNKQLYAVALCLVLILSVSVMAEEVVDRYDQIFDASQDAGKLTARLSAASIIW